MTIDEDYPSSRSHSAYTDGSLSLYQTVKYDMHALSPTHTVLREEMSWLLLQP